MRKALLLLSGLLLSLPLHGQTAWKELVSPTSVATGAALFAHTWSVQHSEAAWNRGLVNGQLWTFCLTSEAVNGVCPNTPKKNIAKLPWQDSPFAYVVTGGAAVGSSYLAHELKQSRHGWIRAVGHVVQPLIVAGSLAALGHNLGHVRTPGQSGVTVRF